VTGVQTCALPIYKAHYLQIWYIFDYFLAEWNRHSLIAVVRMLSAL
jgi:hypothetical protein